MYIISKFRDYYDGVAGSGIDKTIVYERHKLEEKPDILLKPEKFFNRNRYDSHEIYSTGSYERGINLHPYVIGFCGKTYVVYKVFEGTPGSTSEFLYNVDLVKDRYSKYYKRPEKHFTERIQKTFDKWHDKDNSEMFFKLNVPIFVIDVNPREEKLIINDELGQYQFYKLFDSYRAFQEVQMFISGVLGVGNKPIIQISDKDKILGHGYDLKTSFRNPDPPKRKQK